MHKIRRLVSLSETLEITRRIRELEGEGVKVFNLSVGEPDFPTPEPIREAGIQAIREGFTRYTAAGGIPELRKALAEVITRKTGMPYQPSEVMVTLGGKFAIAASILALIKAGDEVIIPTPCWLSYPAMVTLAGGKGVWLPTKEEEGFFPTPESLKEKLTPKTRLILLNSPQNPTGQVLSKERWDQLWAVLKDHPTYILSDEVYDTLTYDGMSHLSLGQYPALRNRLLLVNSFSKAYCMTGWRIGYLAAPAKILRAVEAIQSQMTSSPCSISQKAALAALSLGEQWTEPMRALYQKRKDLMGDLLRKIPRVSFLEPKGAFYFFIKVEAYLRGQYTTSQALSQVLLEEYHVATVPGSCFGQEGYLRLSFATSEEDIREGVAHLSQGLQALG